MTTMLQRTLPDTSRKTERIDRDPEATAEFQRVARAVTELRESRDPALSALIASRGLGLSPTELEEVGLPSSPDL